MRDPLAANPAQFFASSGVAASTVDSHWEPYEGLYPPFVAARAAALLRPPAGVSLDFRDGTLTASGAAPVRWIVDSERLAPAIAGVRRFDYAGTAPAQQLKGSLEGLSVLFAKGQSVLPADQFERISEATALLALLNDAVRVGGRTARVEVLGHTDNDGSDFANGPLSRARAETVLQLLRAPVLDALSFSSLGVGSTAPAMVGTSEAEKVRNRRASFRVALSDQAVPGSRP